MALNGKPGVSERTRANVMAAAQEMGYDFSRLLDRKQPSGTVSFIFYRRQGAVVSDTPFFSLLSEGVEAACKQASCKLRVFSLYKSDDVEQELRDIVISGCSGIILLGTEMRREDFQPFEKLSLPLVVLDVYFDEVKHDCILINNIQGAFLATDYLIQRTKSQPGYLRSAYPIANFDERADGFYRAVRHHGLSTSKSIIHRLPPSIEGAFADMMAILESGDELARCYFADNDMIAIGAIRAMQAKGIKIPGDVAIIGFDDISPAAFMEPPLTTINVPKQYMGGAAVRRLLERMREGTHLPVKIEIGTSIVIRKTV